MKDLPHHLKKLNRQILRSLHREETDEEAYEVSTPRKPTERQIKKQAKEKRRKERFARAPSSPDPEAQNRAMKHRVPVFDQNNAAKPRSGARPTHKKTPPI